MKIVRDPDQWKELYAKAIKNSQKISKSGDFRANIEFFTICWTYRLEITPDNSVCHPEIMILNQAVIILSIILVCSNFEANVVTCREY